MVILWAVISFSCDFGDGNKQIFKKRGITIIYWPFVFYASVLKQLYMQTCCMNLESVFDCFLGFSRSSLNELAFEPTQKLTSFSVSTLKSDVFLRCISFICFLPVNVFFLSSVIKTV